MTAEDVKRRLYGRHPAHTLGGAMGVGEWTVLEEWENIDLIAFSAWSGGKRVGYEVKVSRGDMRSELLAPDKRAWAVAFCHEFYFAVPKGLLKPEEVAFEEPVWEPGDFERGDCPGVPAAGAVPQHLAHRDLDPAGLERARPYGGRCSKYRRWSGGERSRGFTVIMPRPAVFDVGSMFDGRRPDPYIVESQGRTEVVCPTCKGKGYVRRSNVEEVAPILWVPADCGLVEIDGGGCRVVKRAPKRKSVPELGSHRIGQLVRWASARPDPRHRRRDAMGSDDLQQA